MSVKIGQYLIVKAYKNGANFLGHPVCKQVNQPVHIVTGTIDNPSPGSILTHYTVEYCPGYAIYAHVPLSPQCSRECNHRSAVAVTSNTDSVVHPRPIRGR